MKFFVSIIKMIIIVSSISLLLPLSISSSVFVNSEGSFSYTPGVVFLDLVYTLTTPELLQQDPVDNDHVFRINLGRSGYNGDPLSVNFALSTIDLSGYRKNASSDSGDHPLVPMYDNAILMLYCDTTKYVDEFDTIQDVPQSELPSGSSVFTSSSSSDQQKGRSKNSIFGSNLCNTVQVFLKLPSMGASRVQWVFKQISSSRATSADLLNFTDMSRGSQRSQGNFLDGFSFAGWERILWGQKYCRDFYDECMYHAFSCSSTYQRTSITDRSEAFPVYNLGHRFYPSTEFRNLWTAISSPRVAPIMPSDSELAAYGPFSNRMSASFPNLENNAWLMSINRLPPTRVLEPHEPFASSDQATIVMQMTARPSTLIPEGFVLAGTLLSIAVLVGISLFLIICKAIVPRILYLRQIEAEGHEGLLERIDAELIERFEQQRLAEENRNSLIARLGRVTGAPLTPEDLESLEDWTKLPVGDMIQAAIVEERRKATKEQLSTVSDKFAALPRVLFARALRMIDKSLFSTKVEGADGDDEEDDGANDDGGETPLTEEEEFERQYQREVTMEKQQVARSSNNNNNSNNDRPNNQVVSTSSTEQQQSEQRHHHHQQHQKRKRLVHKGYTNDEGYLDDIADADLVELVTDAATQARDNVKKNVISAAGSIKTGVVYAKDLAVTTATKTVEFVETGAQKVVEGGVALRDRVFGASTGTNNNSNDSNNNSQDQQQHQQQSSHENVDSDHFHHEVNSLSSSINMKNISDRNNDNNDNSGYGLGGEIMSPEDSRRNFPNDDDEEISNIINIHDDVRGSPEVFHHNNNDGTLSDHVTPQRPNQQQHHQHQDFAEATCKGGETDNNMKASRRPPPLYPNNGHNTCFASSSSSLYSSPPIISGLSLAAAAGASPHHENQRFFEQQINQANQNRQLVLQAENHPQNSHHNGGGTPTRAAVHVSSQRRFKLAAHAVSSLSGNLHHRRSLSTASAGIEGPTRYHRRSLSTAMSSANNNHNNEKMNGLTTSPGLARTPSPSGGGAAAGGAACYATATFEDVLERHLQEDRRLLDDYKNDGLPSHSFDPFSTEKRPDDVPHCRRCGDVLPFVDLFAPCSCTSTATRYVHRSCLEAERRIDAFSEGGRHAEFCFRCRVCRARYRIAPNSISVFGSVPMKSPLAQTINKLLTNPIAPMLAMWIMVWICGYFIKFVSATLTLDYVNTDWSALRVYHWVLGAFFLLSFSLCEWSLRPFFEIFTPQTRRIVIMAVAALAPLLLGYVGHFLIKLVSTVAWSWESFYGLGVFIEFLLFAYVVPKLALFVAKGAGNLYDRLPISAQRILQKIVP